MSRKIHKITRNLMMMALSLSLLLGLGFVLSPAGLADGLPDVRVTAGGTVGQELTLEAFLLEDGAREGLLLRSVERAGSIPRHGSLKSLDLGGNTLTLTGAGPTVGGAGSDWTIHGDGALVITGELNIVATGTIVFGTNTSPLGVLRIPYGGRLQRAGSANTNLVEPNVTRFELYSGASLGGASGEGDITINNGQTLAILGTNFTRVENSVLTVNRGGIITTSSRDVTFNIHNPLGGEPTFTGPGNFVMTGAGSLPNTVAIIINDGGRVGAAVGIVGDRTATIYLDNGTFEVLNITAAGDQVLGGQSHVNLNGFDIDVSAAGGTVNFWSTTPGAGRVLLNDRITFGRLERPWINRLLTIGGDASVENWTTGVLRPFFGTVNLTNSVTVITAPIFQFEDGKTLNVGPNATLRNAGTFTLGSEAGVGGALRTAEINVNRGVSPNVGTIVLGGEFRVAGRSTLTNNGVINLNGNTLRIVDSLLETGASFVNASAGVVTGALAPAGSTIHVVGGRADPRAISGTFVNAGQVGELGIGGAILPGHVALTVGGSLNARDGAVVVNNNVLNLRTVTVVGGGDGTVVGRGGTLENNATLRTWGVVDVHEAANANSTAGTLNNNEDGLFRIEAGSGATIRGGTVANADAGILTNVEGAEMFVQGTLTLQGGTGNVDAGAVEFTNEGGLTVYDRAVGAAATINIGAGSADGPSARMINEGDLVLGSDQRDFGSSGFINLLRRDRNNAGTRATFVNDSEMSVLGRSEISVISELRPIVERLGLFQNTADGLIRVTARGAWGDEPPLHAHYLPTGTFENSGIVTFTAFASALTVPATDVFGSDGIAIGVGPYYWSNFAVARGAWPFAGLGHRQILSVYGNGGTFSGRHDRLNVNEIHMTGGEDRLVDLGVLANFNLVPARAGVSLVEWNTQRNGQGVSFAPGATVEVIGTLQPGQPNPDVIWAQWVRPTPGISFGDVGAGRFYFAAVRWAANTDPAIARGFGDNTFRPGRDLTRGEFVTMLYRLAGEPSVAGLHNPFTDVGAGRFYENAVIWAFHHDVARGFDGTTQFRPGVRMTREQVATTLYRMANASPAPANALHGFPDAGDITPFALNAVNWAVANGIMGRATGTLRPLGDVTRGEAVTMIFRAYERGLLP